MFSSIFDPNLSSSVSSHTEAPSPSITALEYVVNHVFSPVYHQYDDHTEKNGYTLACVVHTAAHAFIQHVDDAYKPKWLCLVKMLANLQLITEPVKLTRDCVISQLDGMLVGDSLVFLAPHVGPTCGVMFRKQDHYTLYEVLPTSQNFTLQKRACSYPQLAIEIPSKAFGDEHFRCKLASILASTGQDSWGMLTKMLLDVGHSFESKHITKQVPPNPRDVRIRTKNGEPRRFRSELWFALRVAIKLFLDHFPLGHSIYKAFILFLACNLANHAVNTNLSGILLHSMSAKMLRRLRKHGSSIPQWLFDAVLQSCSQISQTLHKKAQAMRCSLPLWNPSRLDLARDTQLSLNRIDSRTNRRSDPSHPAFLPNSYPRPTLNDLLSHGTPTPLEIRVASYDVEWAIEEDMDDWVACTTNIDQACRELLQLSAGYARSTKQFRADRFSMLLTIIEIWIILDKLLVMEIPILADYSPEVPFALLDGLLLHRGRRNIHRFCRARQYLSARHTRAHPGWSVYSNEFTEHSFPSRYYDNSLCLQLLKARIQDTLPTEPVRAKVAVFRLQCPVNFYIWCAVTCWISQLEIRFMHLHTPEQLSGLANLFSILDRSILYPRNGLYHVHGDSFKHSYKLPSGPYTSSGLQLFLSNTTHTSNEILASQVNCHRDLSLDMFIAFAHLRSGGSLQWLNILRELRSRTLEFRHEEVYLLLAQASTQIGPLESAGTLLWHQELEGASFCHAFQEELENLFIDVAGGSADGPVMAIISLLASILASQHFEDVVGRAIKLLRNVRKKTFDWVRDLLYDVMNSPVSKAGFKVLQDMAAVCRSTFDVDSTIRNELLCSPQDIEIALSCAMLIRTIAPVHLDDSESTYSQVLLNRDRHLSLVLEGRLRETIQADTSDVGIDRAVQMVLPGYRPGVCRWKPLQPPDSRWLVCEMVPTKDKHSQMVHVNLLDGSILVDGKHIVYESALPGVVRSSLPYRTLFGDEDLRVVASDLPGMDFATLSMIHKHHVHFAVCSGEIVIRAVNKDMNGIFELIPEGSMQKDLPRSLIHGYVHWLNLSTSIIEVRPVERPWDQSSDNWTVHLRSQAASSGPARVTRKGEFLVDKCSPTWAMISSRLRSLEDPENLIITLSTAQSPSSLPLSVALPRYGLSFFLNETENLESRDYKDMVYDEGQCIGTLFGLVNRLILRPKVQIEADLVPKLILVPHGRLLCCSTGNIRVDIPRTWRVRYYVYQVDHELGCLKGTVNLESRLYLADLHALAGFVCTPDPLTGRTGIEEAISLVWLAGVRQQCDVRPESLSIRSPQITFALKKLHSGTNFDPQYPREDDLVRESYLFPSEVTAGVQLHWKASLGQLIHQRAVPSLRPRNRLRVLCSNNHKYHRPRSTDSLCQLFASLRTSSKTAPFQSQYISRFHRSAQRLQKEDPIDLACRCDNRIPSIDTLREHYVHCRTSYRESLDMIKIVLGPETEFELVLDRCGQWPRITPFVLFRCLSSTSPTKLSESWKECIISLALLALDLQRARRILRFALDNLEEVLYKELENEGCDGWDAAKHPDWLLVQLQSDFLIRRDQANIANEMMSPRSGKNAVIQVNMGEGKTSVIIPICAAALADGNKLVRVIAPEALIPKMLQLLVDRLSGLVGKPIYYLTFTRREMNEHIPSMHDYLRGQYLISKVKYLHALVRECKDVRGITIMQPEHVLSLKLACVEMQLLQNRIWTNPTSIVQKQGFERVLHVLTGTLFKSLTENAVVSAVIRRVSRSSNEPGAAKSRQVDRGVASLMALLELHGFLENHARDILDESDDVLRPQFQLTYAIGHPYPIEDSPDRWLIIQQVLGLVKSHVELLSASDSQTIQCHRSSPGAFPHIHILQTEGGQQLVSLIADDVLDGALSSLSFHPELGLRGAIRKFILYKDIHPDIAKMVESYARQSTSWGSLLLLRGLLAHDILLFAVMQRRWRVDYGLDTSTPSTQHNRLSRTMLAIPYRAKDVPAEAAEFGHPDVVIVLTCLSYYYEGLSEEQLKASFELLLQQDDPSSEYTLWLGDCGVASVPDHLRKLGGINIRSLEQWGKYLVPLFIQNKMAIDLYLSKVVFAKYAKEFPRKITGSYWDLAEQKNHLVTGFSGTNDGQYLLPTSIIQDDPDYLLQKGTNAMVLAYLLQPENSSYVVMTDENGKQCSTRRLLQTIVAQNPQIRVLLDVGAQILDLSNLQLAEAWLECTSASETAGAIYFSEGHELMVLTRNGTTQLLSSSPLAQQLHLCVVYLDDAHTRGTDLRFPSGFRAAVTLGFSVTKDRLVQGCMRMRGLGHGHSVMFFTPREVDHKIRTQVAKQNPNVTVTTADVLHWVIHETWDNIQRLAPYWAQQGVSHHSRYEAWSRFCRAEVTAEELANAWIQPEIKSLVDMYMSSHSAELASSVKLPRNLRERCEALGIFSLPNVCMDEEQEREVSREIQREREVLQRPPRTAPAIHFLHPDVITCVRTGVVPSPSWSAAFRHVFTTGIDSGFASSSAHDIWSPCLLATADFCETIMEGKEVEGRMNDYLRHVQWVLSGKMGGKNALVLLSPFEVELLMPEIRISKHVHLHLYIPRTSERMKPSDDLRLYSIPPVPADWTPPWPLIDQLNIFSGQLYLSDYSSYVRLSHFLGVQTEDVPNKASSTGFARNWFSDPDSSDSEIKDRFKGTKLPLMMQLLAVRSGMGFAGTHMGKIINGWPLTQGDFSELGISNY